METNDQISNTCTHFTDTISLRYSISRALVLNSYRYVTIFSFSSSFISFPLFIAKWSIFMLFFLLLILFASVFDCLVSWRNFPYKRVRFQSALSCFENCYEKTFFNAFILQLMQLLFLMKINHLSTIEKHIQHYNHHRCLRSCESTSKSDFIQF